MVVRPLLPKVSWTGDFQEGGKKGFFIQDETGDGDDATSDGIFVYYPNAPEVNVGDKLRITGRVSEYYELTQITGSALQVCSTGNTIEPVVLTLPFDSKTTNISRVCWSPSRRLW